MMMGGRVHFERGIVIYYGMFIFQAVFFVRCYLLGWEFFKLKWYVSCCPKIQDVEFFFFWGGGEVSEE